MDGAVFGAKDPGAIGDRKAPFALERSLSLFRISLSGLQQRGAQLLAGERGQVGRGDVEDGLGAGCALVR